MASGGDGDKFQRDLMGELAALKAEIGGLRSVLKSPDNTGVASAPQATRTAVSGEGNKVQAPAQEPVPLGPDAQPLPGPGALALKQLNLQATLGVELQKLTRQLEGTRQEMDEIRNAMQDITGDLSDVRKGRARPRRTVAPSSPSSRSPAIKSVETTTKKKQTTTTTTTSTASKPKVAPRAPRDYDHRKPHEKVTCLEDLDKPDVRDSIERDLKALGVEDPHFIESIKSEYTARKRKQFEAKRKKPFSDMSYDRFNLDDIMERENKPLSFKMKVILILGILSSFIFVILPAINRRLSSLNPAAAGSSSGSPQEL